MFLFATAQARLPGRRNETSLAKLLCGVLGTFKRAQAYRHAAIFNSDAFRKADAIAAKNASVRATMILKALG